jgi:L-ribulose-5-phosphate 3-epimerase
MKFGTIVNLTAPGDALEKFNKLMENGIESCQLIYRTAQLKTEDARIIRKAAEDAGIEISAQFVCYRDSFCTWDTRFDFINAGINSPIFGADRITYVCSAIPFLQELGVTDMILHAGHISNDPFSDSYSRMLSAVAVLSTKLKAAGLNLLFETGPESPVTLLKLIKETGAGNLYVNLDTGNLIMYGFGNPVDALTTIGKYVRNTHFKDGLPPTDPYKIGKEVPIGQGNVDFAKVIKLLKELGYDRYITIEREISGPEQMRDILKSMDYLNKLWKEE